MEKEKDKLTEKKEQYQNVYNRYLLYDAEWHRWKNFIDNFIKTNGANSELITNQIKELDKYMFESKPGKMWYEHNCPDIKNSNTPGTSLFLFWWGKDCEREPEETMPFFFNYSKWQYLKSLKQPQQADKITLPEELNTKKAKALLQKLISMGYCDEDFKWNKTKALLAYFADKATEYLNISPAENATNWKPFEVLFKITKLADSKNEYKNKTGTFPKGSKDIDKLFE